MDQIPPHILTFFLLKKEKPPWVHPPPPLQKKIGIDSLMSQEWKGASLSLNYYNLKENDAPKCFLKLMEGCDYVKEATIFFACGCCPLQGTTIFGSVGKSNMFQT